MKIKLPLALKKTLLTAIIVASSQISSLYAVTITIDTPGAQALAWQNNSDIVFDANDAVVSYNSNLSGFLGLTVNSTGSSLSSTGANYIVFGGNSTLDINEDFTLDLGSGSSSTNQFDRNFAMSGHTITTDVASGKTFNLLGDIVGDSGGGLVVQGGGTLNYTYTDINSAAGTQHAGVHLTISNATFDISSNDAAHFGNLMLQGNVNLNDGATMKLMTGNISMSHTINASGATTITGATNLTLTGRIDVANTSTLIDFGTSAVNLSGITLDLGTGYELDTSYSLFKTTQENSAFDASGIANFTITGLTSSSHQTVWSYDADLDTYSYMIVSSSGNVWQGGNGTLVNGEEVGWSGGPVNTANDIEIANEGGTITVDSGGATVNSITVTGNNNYTINGGSLTMQGELTMEGAGTLTLATSGTGLHGEKTVTSGTLAVGTATALGNGLIHLASGTTLEIASGLGEVVNTIDGENRRYGAGYTVRVGENTTFTENARLWMGGGTVTITGGGTYEVSTILLNQPSGQSTTLSIEAGTTFSITGEALSTSGGSGAFMVGHWPNVANTLNISGKLISNAGLSTSSGTVTINVNDGGELELLKGLVRVSANNAQSTLNVQSGGTLTLHNRSGNQASMNLNIAIQNNATIKAGVTTGSGFFDTTVTDTFNYAENASVNFLAEAFNQRLILDHAVDLGTGTASMSGTGYVSFAQGGSMGAIDSEGVVEIRNNASLEVTNSATIGEGQIEITAADATAPIVMSAHTSESATISGFQLTNATIDNGSINMNSTDLWLSNSVISNSSITNTEQISLLSGTTELRDTTLEAGTTLGIASNVTLILSGASLSGIEDIIAADDTSRLVAIGLDMSALNSTLTIPAETSKQHTSESLAAGGEMEDMYVYELSYTDINTLTTLDITVDDTLTLNLNLSGTDLDDFYARYRTGLVGIELLNVDEFQGYYGNVEIIAGTGEASLFAQGVVLSTDGNVLFYIPEPSTATLSLLALTGLLARRRRKNT